MTNLITWLRSHEAFCVTAAAWATREAHVWWPRIVQIYPYCRDNGGVFGIIGKFFKGQPATSQQSKP
jgi:hypothetical protein